MLKPDSVLATLASHNIKTLGDLDDWRQSRGLRRDAALDVLVGREASDLIIGALAVRIAQEADYWANQYRSTGDRGGALL